MPPIELTFQVPPEQLAVLRQALKRHGAVAQRLPPKSAAGAGLAVDAKRLACAMPDGAARIDVALDEGRLVAGASAQAVRALTLASDDPHALFALAKDWTAGHGLSLDTRSLGERAGVLARGGDHGPPVKASTPAVEPGLSGPRLLRRVIRSTLDQVLANASEVAAGSTDEEHVHQLRVGLRRLRTALRELRALDAGIDAAWQAPLAATFAQLGQLRDDDTVARAVRPLLEQAGAPKVEWTAPAEPVDAGATVRDARFQAVLLDLLRFAAPQTHDMTHGDAMPHDAAVAHLRRRLGRLHRRVARGGKRFESLAPEDQHRVRKRLKRLRYLAEFVAPLWPGKAVQRYLKHLGPAQDALGRHNDIAVAAGRFRDDAATDPRALFAAGLLQGHLRVTARDAHEALAEVADARRFWKR